jgi:CheY-like chemotaxis protein
MPPESSRLLVQVLRKIPLFTGLSPSQVKKILSLCVHRDCEPGAQICRSGSASDEMYVLLSGELAVVTREGLKVAVILPVTTVGEMGVITGHQRSATVEATKPSNVFAIHKAQFDHALRDDLPMQVQVYRNIIDVLAAKLVNDNIRVRDYQLEKSQFEGRIARLEKQLALGAKRLGIALDLASERAGISRDELELHIADQVEDQIPRILIVDDEADFRTLVKNGLASFAVVEAGSGQQALGLVQEHKLDLVITDIRMPQMDGFALLEKLRAQFAHLPVLAVSGYLDSGEVEGRGFDGFIDKPVSLPELQGKVEEILAAHQPEPDQA